MVGWSLLLAALTSLFLILFWRSRKRLQTTLVELSSRVAQVEELLLEICSVIEEKEPFPQFPSLSETEDSVPEEVAVGSPVSVPLTDTNPAGSEKEITSQEQEESEKDNMEKTLDQQEMTELKTDDFTKKTGAETAQPKSASLPRRREINKERLDQIDPSTLPERSKTIIELLQKGLSVKEIARTSGIGQGEVQLIIDLYLQ